MPFRGAGTPPGRPPPLEVWGLPSPLEPSRPPSRRRAADKLQKWETEAARSRRPTSSSPRLRPSPEAVVRTPPGSGSRFRPRECSPCWWNGAPEEEEAGGNCSCLATRAQETPRGEPPLPQPPRHRPGVTSPGPRSGPAPSTAPGCGAHMSINGDAALCTSPPCSLSVAGPGFCSRAFLLHLEEASVQAGRGAAKEDRDGTWAQGAVGRILRKQRSNFNIMGKRNSFGGICGSHLPISNVPHENLPHWSLESDVFIPESKNLPSGRESAAGGKLKKNHLEIPVEQLIELSLSENPQKRSQNNSKSGMFQFWSYPHNEAITVENRDFQKSSMESGFNINSNPLRLFTLNHSLTDASVDKQASSYSGLQQDMPLSLCWPYADGDFCKDRSESQSNSYLAIESNNGETLSASNWNTKYGNSSIEENLTDESDLSENEKVSDTLLTYFKKMDLNLKPEVIEDFEESFLEQPSEVFSYPDFLPPPFNTIDLHKLAFSKSENWKVALDPIESSIEQLIGRLLEMERIQHLTIQKEKPKIPANCSTQVITERPSSSKGSSKQKPARYPESVPLQTACTDKNREKRKNTNFCKLEQNTSKCSWNNGGKYKWNSRPPSIRSSSTTKQIIATYDDFKIPKGSSLSPCQEVSSRPTSSHSIAQATQPLVKMVSTRCLQPKSPIPVTSLSLFLPEAQEGKPSRSKKKLYRKNIAVNRPLHVQKRHCLSPSSTAKCEKCSHVDQK
ncbi:protein FAM217A [Sminthopsis crassicaudata]|uniref:protein FAM217A n=1 Tax=Sminthopsis crassicaudata TaxID=9301 RepID=UPI003D682ED9